MSCFSPFLFPYVPAWLSSASLQLFVPCEPFCVLDAFENIALMPFGQSMLCIWLACDALPLDLRLP